MVQPSATTHHLLPESHHHSRKEFLHDQHTGNRFSFSLLTLAGEGLVRLYGFSDSAIHGLRGLFEQHHIVSCHDSMTNHFVEFVLDSKPWADLKSLAAERLILLIMTVIYQHGYSFLSAVEHAREHDDRIALAFSQRADAKPCTPATLNASTIPQAGPILFAISFPSTASLRVIMPPSEFTPGILQAVRNTWARKVSSEKRVGDSYELKLKGYNCASLAHEHLQHPDAYHYCRV